MPLPRLFTTRGLVRWLPLFVLLLAAYWRINNLPDQSLWNDEGNSYNLIQQTPAQIFKSVSLDIHPPAYYLFLKYWSALMGESELGLRSLSALWGLLAVALTYALGARLYAKAAGICAALLVAMNPLAVYYSQEARMYAQLACLTVLSLYLLTRLIMGEKKWGWWLALGVVNLVGLYTHYTYPFTMLTQGMLFLAWLVGWQVRAYSYTPLQVIGFYIGVNLLTLLCFAPWLPTAYRQITTWPPDDSGIAFTEKIQMIATYITFGNSASNLGIMDFLWIGVLFLALFLPDWYKQPPRHWWRVGLPLVWIALVAGSVLFLGAFREANLKFLLPAQIGVVLLVGRGAYFLWDSGSGSAAVPLETIPRYVAALAFGMVVLSTYNWLGVLRSDFQKDDYRALAAQIEANSTSQDAVILNAGGQSDVFNYYFEGQAAVYPLPRGWNQDDTATRTETLALIQQHPRIFVVFWGEGERDPRGIVKQTLDENAYELESRWFGDVRLVQYGVLAPPPPTPTNPLGIQFGEHIALKGYALSGDLQAGSPSTVLGVTLFWETAAPLDKRYKIFVQLLNPAGQLIAQHDSEPANNRRLTLDWKVDETIVDNHGLIIPANLAQGRYTLIVGLYELENPSQRLLVGSDDFWVLERLDLD